MKKTIFTACLLSVMVIAAGCSTRYSVFSDASDTTAPDVADAIDATEPDDISDTGEVRDASDNSDVATTEDTSDATDPGPQDLGPDTLTMDDEIRLNQIQIKGTHNSYHLQTFDAVPEWLCTMDPLNVQLEEQGVRQIELDIHLNYEDTLDVYHLPGADPGTTCQKFTECLSLVKTWSNNNHDHLPVIIMIEPKDELDGDDLSLLGKLGMAENEILSVFSEDDIIKPDDVRGAHATLREALTTDGWPTLRQCRNKVMFVLLDNNAHHDSYLAEHPDLQDALIFARNGKGETWSSVLELNGPDNPERETEITAALAENYLVRSNADGVETTFEEFQIQSAAALRSGAHLINTDHPSELNVTSGTGAGYRFDIPEGNPARCNPINAPVGCTSIMLENLR